MKKSVCLFALCTLAATAAHATSVGDKAVYKLTNYGGGIETVTEMLELRVVAVRQEGGKTVVDVAGTRTLPDGSTAEVDTGYYLAWSDELAQDDLATCDTKPVKEARDVRRKLAITVPAGTFESCYFANRFDEGSDDRWVGNVPLGWIKNRTSFQNGYTQERELVSFERAK